MSKMDNHEPLGVSCGTDGSSRGADLMVDSEFILSKLAALHDILFSHFLFFDLPCASYTARSTSRLWEVVLVIVLRLRHGLELLDRGEEEDVAMERGEKIGEGDVVDPDLIP